MRFSNEKSDLYFSTSPRGLFILSGCGGNDAPGGGETGVETAASPEDEEMIGAVYLGVYGYGTGAAHRSNMDSFLYRFLINGKEKLYKIDNGEKDADGNYNYPVQNVLKIGYSYVIEEMDGVIVSAEEVLPAFEDSAALYVPPVSGEPGLKTVKNFLKTALEPVGTALYIYGGGWDWQDAGSSIAARTTGVSPDWVRFFNSQDSSFTYRDKDGDEKNRDPENSYYPYNGYNEYYYAGLDCSGYVSWALNNTFNKDRTEVDLFCGSTVTAWNLARRGFGARAQDTPPELKPGDVVSISGHVWICLGVCGDGSAVILHSTPSKSRAGQPGGGVQISAIGDSTECEAYKLADGYMSGYYKEWYSRYPVKLCDPAVYLAFEGEYQGAFSWDASGGSGGLTDPDGLRGKDASEILADLFGQAAKSDLKSKKIKKATI